VIRGARLAALAALLRTLAVAGVLALTAALPALAADGAKSSGVPEATLTIANRDIVTFRALLLDKTPDMRAERARARVLALQHDDLAYPVRALPASLGELRGMQVLVGDTTIFSLLPADLDPEEKLTLEQAAERARHNLEDALIAVREQRRWPVLLLGLAHAAGVTAFLVFAYYVLNRVGLALLARLERYRDALAARTSGVQMREYAVRLLINLLQLGRWVLIAVLVYAWLAYVLDHFPLTSPLGHGLAQFVLTLLDWIVEGSVAAIPSIVTIAVILAVARAIVQVIGQFFQSVQSGRTQVPFLQAETAGATRRIVTMLVWLLAVAVAYPFIPGSGSDAFKGLSVLVGVMISLGSTGLVTQMMSGLVIVYSRALRRGDFVIVNGVEGVVGEVGTLATKVITMRNEEVTIPNSVLVASPIHNYSKLAGSQGTLLATKVTIGYDAPWRQVHAMLILAAKRTSGLRAQPEAFVYQRALGDFYVEYELFVYVDNPLTRVATLSALHANIQDVFNENGVQILSPHFVLQPRRPVVVPPEHWYARPAQPPEAPKG
jgi:small-conductance mechanosensitive channel